MTEFQATLFKKFLMFTCVDSLYTQNKWVRTQADLNGGGWWVLAYWDFSLLFWLLLEVYMTGLGFLSSITILSTAWYCIIVMLMIGVSSLEMLPSGKVFSVPVECKCLYMNVSDYKILHVATKLFVTYWSEYHVLGSVPLLHEKCLSAGANMADEPSSSTTIIHPMDYLVLLKIALPAVTVTQHIYCWLPTSSYPAGGCRNHMGVPYSCCYQLLN